MATEEQTTYSAWITLAAGGGDDKCGQRLTISNRIVSELGFWLKKRGSPTTEVLTFEIRKVSDDSVICSKEWGLASNLGASAAYKEVTFDTAAYINEEVRILASIEAETEANGAYFADERNDVKASEYRTSIVDHPGGSWVGQVNWDAAYIYTYTAPSTSPTVTNQAVTAISGTIATGNGNVTSLGDTDVTQHGHCWNTTGTPNVDDDSKTENGAKATTGAFTSSITGLTAGTKYYVRAYAVNSVGTSYSSEVVFWADKGTVFPSDAVARVSSIRHIFRSGFFRMQVAVGDIGFDVDMAEVTVRKALDTAKEVEEAVAEVAPAVEEVAPAVREPRISPVTGEPYPFTPPEIMEPLYVKEAERQQVIAERLGIAAPTARTIRIQVEESDKMAILQEIARLNKMSRDPGITPYARDVFLRAITRKQDELEALYRRG